MSATNGAILSLLTGCLQHRDRVGLVVFQKYRAHVVLPPTNSVQLAQKALAEYVPVGVERHCRPAWRWFTRYSAGTSSPTPMPCP